MPVMSISADEFDRVILSDTPVLVDFWAPWCGYCVRLSPIIDKIAEAYSGRVKVVKINLGEVDIGGRYGIVTIPTLILFQNGEPSAKLVNPESRSAIEEWLKSKI